MFLRNSLAARPGLEPAPFPGKIRLRGYSRAIHRGEVNERARATRPGPVIETFRCKAPDWQV